MFFKRKLACLSISMPQAAKEMENDTSIHLIDVRTDDEYNEGHISGSILLPLNQITEIVKLIPDKDTRIFLYCYSGARSETACLQLMKLGYTNVFNIGGIIHWTGFIERTVSV